MNNEPEISLPEKAETAPSTDNGGVKFLKLIFDIIEMITLAVIVVLLVFTFCSRLCRVDGRSMNNTLRDGEMLITTNIFYEPRQGDIVVFHLSNEYYEQPLVKRVIATEGQTVKLNFVTGEVTVDGQLLDEGYIFLDGGLYQVKQEFDRYYISKEPGGSLYFEATVPEGHIFVMGDNRNHSTDSRSHLVGFVDKDCVLGKAIVRISPFTVFD